MEGTTYELKYCERCGSLGLRRAKSAENYCQPCGQALVNYSLPPGAARRLRLRKPEVGRATPSFLEGTAEAVMPGGRLQ
jgi:ribosomal protein L37AE/L43A